MHVRELIDLAGLIAAHGPALIQCDETIPTDGIEQYWTASKVRLDRWSRSLRAFTKQVADVETNDANRRISWQETRSILEEILGSEILTRVWTAALCAHDRRHGTSLTEPIARSVLLGHTEARHRALNILVRGQGLDLSEGMELNHLRRHAERWSDLLIGRFENICGVEEFAGEPERAAEFSKDQSAWHEPPQNQIAWPLAMASLRASFQHRFHGESPNADVNARIVGGILACFPPDLFLSNGRFRSLWMLRLSAATDDVQGIVTDLLKPEPIEETSLRRIRLPRGRIR